MGTTQLSGNIKFQFDDNKLTFASSSPILSSQTNGELTFNFTNINPFDTKIIRVYFSVAPPPIVINGSQLNLTATINPIINDVAPSYNVFQLNHIVIGSYNPNDINVLEGESILINQIDNYLHYMIRFQNTGTANATNIVVKNTLDDGLDWNTIQIDGISSSNNFIIIRNGKEISFVFNGINLPYSSINNLGSHGFICYKIKPKSTSVVGDIFHNNAQIYFDFNSAINTNTEATQVLNTLNNSDFESNTIKLFPNPTNGKINLSVNFEIANLAIYNIYEQKISEQENFQEIDLSPYSKGVYFIKIEDTMGRIITKKVVKN